MVTMVVYALRAPQSWLVYQSYFYLFKDLIITCKHIKDKKHLLNYNQQISNGSSVYAFY